MGDFLGFTFGNVHSSDLGITRVSGGDRYDEELHPEIKDRTAEVPGLNGEYYFGSDFGPRSFDIEIAFDSLSEKQFRKLRQVFGTKDIKKLIFDERPYKYYLAKLESPIELSYVCFDEPKKIIGAARDGVRVANRIPITEEVEGEEQIIGYTIEREQVTPYEYQEGTQRVYKGEGKITFKAYFPFAKSVYKVLPSNEEGSDWAVSSGILTEEEYSPAEPTITKQPYDSYIIDTSSINVYNPGDVETGFRMYIPFVGSDSATQITLTYQAKENLTDFDILQFTLPKQGRQYGIDENSYDVGVLIDTNNVLIIGVSEYTDNQYITSGNLYNDCIDAGYFFKLQPNDKEDKAKIVITNGNQGIRIFYDYLYF